jgi:hypothetical protein
MFLGFGDFRTMLCVGFVGLVLFILHISLGHPQIYDEFDYRIDMDT